MNKDFSLKCVGALLLYTVLTFSQACGGGSGDDKKHALSDKFEGFTNSYEKGGMLIQLKHKNRERSYYLWMKPTEPICIRYRFCDPPKGFSQNVFELSFYADQASSNELAEVFGRIKEVTEAVSKFKDWATVAEKEGVKDFEKPLGEIHPEQYHSPEINKDDTIESINKKNKAAMSRFVGGASRPVGRNNIDEPKLDAGEGPFRAGAGKKQLIFRVNKNGVPFLIAGEVYLDEDDCHALEILTYCTHDSFMKVLNAFQKVSQEVSDEQQKQEEINKTKSGLFK
jgi:hypothetical protein